MSATEVMHRQFDLQLRHPEPTIEVVPAPFSYSRRKGSADYAEVELLSQHLGAIFLLDEQRIEIFKEILGVAEARSRLAYSRPADINYRLHSRMPWVGIRPSVTCLSGLAGVGKSTLLQAIQRFLHASSKTLEFPDNLPIRKTFPMLLHSAAEGVSLSEVIGRIDESQPVAASNRSREAIVKLLYRNAVCLIALDELQEVAASSSASTHITKLLWRVSELGPAVVYGCNYSLLHKLQSRNQEERDRIVNKRIILRPYEESSRSWIRFLEVLASALGKRFDIYVREYEAELHEMSFGIPRKLIFLLCLAYHQSKNAVIGMKHLRVAFNSSANAPAREELQTLNIQISSRRGEKKDLFSPFDELDGMSSAKEYGRASDMDNALEAAAQINAMTPAERAIHSHAIAEEHPLLATFKPKRARAPKRTEDDLMTNRELFEAL